MFDVTMKIMSKVSPTLMPVVTARSKQGFDLCLHFLPQYPSGQFLLCSSSYEREILLSASFSSRV